jgi:UDP-N-acetylmuramate--alanine ligase
LRSIVDWAGRKVHLVGIGGAGMSAYARAAVALGAEVSGSDRADSPALRALRELGVTVHVGHDAANVPAGADVFHSSAIAPDNPERAGGSRPRADLLGELSALKRTIAVAGAHGKTTTTSMVAHVLLGCGMDPSYLIGGELTTTGRNADWTAGEWLVVEADESDRSMLALDVDVAVVTNVELDHHATYGSLAEVRDVFRAFLDGPEHAVLWDRPDVLALRDGPAVAFDADASPFEWRGHLVVPGVPGVHNARNAAAALEAARLAGADEAQAVLALATFTGAGRRFQPLGHTAGGVLVVDDYAHHPTEVAATLDAARTLGHRRVVALFQPHLYSRTARLWREFGAALARADVVAVMGIYPARERAEDWPGTTGRLVAQAAADHGRQPLWLPTHEQAEAVLRDVLRPGDVLLVLGAGDVDRVGRSLVAQD